MTSSAAARAITRTTRRPQRVLGGALIAYGIVGAVLVTVLALAVAPAMATLDALARSSAEVQLTLRTTHDAFEGFGVSLVEARLSAQRAATTARSTAATARQLADAMGVSIFGARPLAGIATGFERQSTDLESLATELDALALTLGRNERDVGALRDRVGALGVSAATVAAGPPAGLPVAPIVYLLLAWLALQAIAALWAGTLLWRAEGG